MSVDEVTIRECVSIEDFHQCIELERSVWRDDDIDIMPIRLYMISKNCQAPTIGAFTSSGRLVGFVHTSIALMERKVVYHSHMAAVVEELRHQDIGFRLKLSQRDHAKAAGVPLIIWTFDPLQSRNAHFNINKLGVIIRSYKVNYYGEGISSVFDPHVPSDRIIAEWWIQSSHVERVLGGTRPAVDPSNAKVEIPDNIDTIRDDSLAEHLEWRLGVRQSFQNALEKEAIARGFTRDIKAGKSYYHFGPDEDQFQFAAYQ